MHATLCPIARTPSSGAYNQDLRDVSYLRVHLVASVEGKQTLFNKQIVQTCDPNRDIWWTPYELWVRIDDVAAVTFVDIDE